MVVGEKFLFYEAYEEVGVARSHFGSHCNTVDLFVVVVTNEKQLSVRTSSARPQLVEGNGYETRQTSKEQLFVRVFASSRDHDPAHRGQQNGVTIVIYPRVVLCLLVFCYFCLSF